MSFDESQLRLKSANRNDTCPCGSGRKYKKCHLPEDETVVHAELKLREEAAKTALAEEAAKAEETEAGGEPVAKVPAKVRDRQAAARPAKGRAQGRPANLPRRGAV